MIKYIKLGELVFQNLEPKYINEDGSETWNIPQDIEEFRAAAIDTIKWRMGQEIKKSVETSINLSAANSKAIALLAKVVAAQNPDISSLSNLEKQNWQKLLDLAGNGYADSELLLSALSAVESEIAKGTEKITRIMSASTHDEIISILNEE